MWSRKRFDIDYSDLVYGLGAALSCPPQKRAIIQSELERWWGEDARGAAIACLSVRSGWDLLLQALNLPPGSEVAISALTIPDMIAIVRNQGLIPVPIDLDPATMAPDPASLAKAIGPQTGVILVAHLFGGRANIEPLLAARDRYGAILVEDCAQAFTPDYKGHREADVSCFSFGNIKFATALGGALLRVRDPELRDRMSQIQSAYPLQDRFTYTTRLLKYMALKALSTRAGFSSLIFLCRRLGIDYDFVLNQAVRGFPRTELIARLRHQPCAPLLTLLSRRLQRYTPARLASQAHLGQTLVRLLHESGNQFRVPGTANSPHSHWVVPIVAEDPHAAIASLAQAGFDSTQGNSMCVVDPPETHPHLVPMNTRSIFEKMVYLPCYPAMNEAALEQMVRALQAGYATNATGAIANSLPLA